MTADEVISAIKEECNVSRETIEHLDHFSELLERWNSKINLVSPATIPELWSRHIYDSAQLLPLIDENTKQLVDIGTGGGFPGLVLAILAQDVRPDMDVTLIESDQRKCAFLQTVSGQLGLKATVTSKRIESVPSVCADVMTTRALAPLTKLLNFAALHLAKEGEALFLKGKNVEQEIDEALASWAFDLQKIPSKTNADALVLKIRNLRPR